MQAPNDIEGHILVAANLEAEIERLQEELKAFRVVLFFEENFKIEQAKEVTKEAYISEAERKYIIIAAYEFTTVAQNALLKILEEPPHNISFIILSPSKSNLLATVRSRLPLVHKKESKESQQLSLCLSKLDYATLFAFLKEHARIDKKRAKELVEAIFKKATVEECLVLRAEQLEDFDNAYRLLDLNARPQTVLAMVLMGFTGA